MKRGLTTALAAAGVAVTGAVARRGVPSWDRSAFVAINRLPDGLQYVLWGPMQIGALGAPLVVGGVLAVRGDRRAGAGVAASGAATWVAAKMLKRSVGRGRPAQFIDSTKIRLGSADTGLGFPSGHAGVAVALASTFPAEYSIGRNLLCLAPVVVGFGRVHVGAHFPLDVLGGWMLGALVADVTQDAIARLSRRTNT